jgi:hypothetical protein
MIFSKYIFIQFASKKVTFSFSKPKLFCIFFPRTYKWQASSRLVKEKDDSTGYSTRAALFARTV